MEGTSIPVRPGVIYILRNSSHRGAIVKIGRTSRTSEARASELSAPTGVPLPFEVLYEETVADAQRAERLIHARLAAWRLNDTREFFEVPLKDAVRAVFETCLQLNEEYRTDRSRLAIWVESGASFSEELLRLLTSARPGATSVHLFIESPRASAQLHLSDTLLIACTPEFLADLKRREWVKDVHLYVLSGDTRN